MVALATAGGKRASMGLARSNQLLGRAALPPWSPLQAESFLREGAISKVQIDQGLVWDARLFRQSLEVLKWIRI